MHFVADVTLSRRTGTIHPGTDGLCGGRSESDHEEDERKDETICQRLGVGQHRQGQRYVCDGVATVGRKVSSLF